MRSLIITIAVFAGLLACSKSPCADCAGCCDESGQCQPGTGPYACGMGGATCANCMVQHAVCFEQACVLSYDGGGPGGGAGGGSGGGGGEAQDAGGDDAGFDDAGSGDAGTTTWPDGGTLYRYWDGGTCAVKTDCPCFSSDDCGPGFYCHSEDTTGTQVWCVPGARGAGLAGDACTGEADCLSALCTDSASTGMRCSALCTDMADCPASLPTCQYVGFGVDRSLCAP